MSLYIHIKNIFAVIPLPVRVQHGFWAGLRSCATDARQRQVHACRRWRPLQKPSRSSVTPLRRIVKETVGIIVLQMQEQTAKVDNMTLLDRVSERIAEQTSRVFVSQIMDGCSRGRRCRSHRRGLWTRLSTSPLWRNEQFPLFKGVRKRLQRRRPNSSMRRWTMFPTFKPQSEL